jgi:16S rRNA (cytidine1402-2'-O)-methyltransferase
VLYVVGTPIGNLEDLTPRARRVLGAVRLIAAEDTRTARRLLSALDLHVPVTSYFEHNKLAKLDAILDAAERDDVALISEAGMPGLSDPGYELIAAAWQRGIRVVPIPGPSAALLALVASGLPTDSFVFVGFLPRKAGERRARLRALLGERRTVVAYEAPRRLLATLEDLAALAPERLIAVARELTKLHEEVRRGTPGDLLAHYQATPPRGEITLVIAPGELPAHGAADDDVAERLLRALAAAGVPAATATAALAKATGRPRREWYARWLALRRA